MQILANDGLVKYDATLKFFLTCENFEEFEQFKSNPNDFVQSTAMGMLNLKELEIKDTFNYIYSSIKTKLVKNEEPQEMKSGLELETLDGKVLSYINFLNKMTSLIEFRIEYTKQRLEEQKKLVKALGSTQDNDPELERTFQDMGSFYEKEESVISIALKNDMRLLSEIKARKLKQEGIHNAIIDRKNNIEKYTTLLNFQRAQQDYSYKKAENLKTEIQNARERIATINKNLENELEDYSEKQGQSLKSIISNKCYVEKLNGERIAKLVGEASNDLADIIAQPNPREEFTVIAKSKVKKEQESSDDELI
eukprot:TRINITY_DN10754_c0_g4_i5.p1 TRINITY_DN10754_c0_g4~~TRINITY_DN10754_c0_g4_i5.p1  ORF type:complete len:309 (+),score=113.04 TRINITY_DN10754_c0_g4_i5:878-1804(+)